MNWQTLTGRILGLLGVLAQHSGCDEDDLTARERARLSTFVLPALPPDPSNAVADDPWAAALGQQLFFNPRYSGPLTIGKDGTNGGLGPAGTSGLINCASCHDPTHGGVDFRSQPRNTSLGARWGTRNTTPVYDLPYLTWFDWDGRKDSVWSASLGSGEGGNNTSRLTIAHFLYDHYRAPYEQIFGPLPDLGDSARFPPAGKPGDPAFNGMAPGDQVLINRVLANFGKALEAYERLLINRDTPFDRYMRGQRDALSLSAVRGAKLFVGRASCDECHNGPLLSDNQFHNDGVPQAGLTVPLTDNGWHDGIPKLLADVFNAAGPYSDAPSDEYLENLSPQPQDLGAFRTAPLRNVSQTAPYMHTGAFATLWDVLAWYRDAAGSDGYTGTRDAAIQPLRLSDDDLTDLVAFLQALQGAPLPLALITAPALP